jgi:hypothetical protein
MPVSQAVRDAVFAPETAEAFIILLTIEHESLSEPIRVCNNTESIWSNGVEYIPLPFEISLPDETDDEVPSTKLVIDNLSQEITKAIRSISTKPAITLELIGTGQPDIPIWGPSTFDLMDAEYDINAVTGTLGFNPYLSAPWPAWTFNPQDFPAVF